MTDHFRVSCNRAISASPLNFGLPNRYEIFWVHYLWCSLEFNTVHHFVFKNNYRIIVSNGSLYQTSAIFYVPWAYNFKTRYLRIPRSKALSVLCSDRCTNTINSSENDRASNVSARHVMCFSAAVHNVIYSLKREVPGHELNNWSETHHTSTHTNTSETSFSDGRVNNSSVAELFPHTF